LSVHKALGSLPNTSKIQIISSIVNCYSSHRAKLITHRSWIPFCSQGKNLTVHQKGTKILSLYVAILSSLDIDDQT
jgi:hypothetical protein